jgi:hypothetical protein
MRNSLQHCPMRLKQRIQLHKYIFFTLENPSALTNADWQNALYQSGLTQNYNLAIRRAVKSSICLVRRIL